MSSCNTPDIRVEPPITPSEVKYLLLDVQYLHAGDEIDEKQGVRYQSKGLMYKNKRCRDYCYRVVEWINGIVHYEIKHV